MDNSAFLSFIPTLSADHTKAYQEARRLMAEINITNLPVNPREIVKHLGIDMIKYSEAREFRPETIKKLRERKCDAVACRYPNTDDYYIMYDDKQPLDRKRFTIAHEIGHIRLGHVNKMKTLVMRSVNKENDPLEQEANSFAGELLRSPILLALLPVKTASDIQSECNISFESASVGLKQIRRIKGTMYKFCKKEVEFYSMQFYDYISQRTNM